MLLPPGVVVLLPPGTVVPSPPGVVVPSPPGVVVSSPPGVVVSSPPGTVVSSPPGVVVSSPPGTVVSSPPTTGSSFGPKFFLALSILFSSFVNESISSGSNTPLSLNIFIIGINFLLFSFISLFAALIALVAIRISFSIPFISAWYILILSLSPASPLPSSSAIIACNSSILALDFSKNSLFTAIFSSKPLMASIISCFAFLPSSTILSSRLAIALSKPATILALSGSDKSSLPSAAALSATNF